MKYFILLLMLLTTSCAPHKDPRTITGTDPVFLPYIKEYVGYKGRSLNYDIPIQFSQLSGGKIGLCTRWDSGERQIQIDKTYWMSHEDEGIRLQLILHELGHCDLNRNHTSLMYADGQPRSIMFPYVFRLDNINVSDYIHELFHPDSQ